MKLTNTQTIRVLIVEDSEDDTILILMELNKGGYDAYYERVQTAETMKDALRTKKWDIILSDHKMPNFSGLEALSVLTGLKMDIPFIIISGTIGEEIAVEAMKKGAHDYIMKDNLQRLLPAIERELREAKTRTERTLLEQKKKQTEEALHASEERFSTAFQLSPVAIVILRDEDSKIIDVNEVFCKNTGYTREEIIGRTTIELGLYANPSDREKLLDQLRKYGVVESFEMKAKTKTGVLKSVILAVTYITINKELHHLCSLLDITERKKTEEKLKILNTALEAAANAIVVTDKSGKIIWLNKAFVKLTGFDANETIGKSPGELVKSGKHDEKFYANMWDTILKGYIWSGEIINKRKDASFYTEYMTITPVEEKNNDISHFIAVKQDITEKKETDRKILNAIISTEEKERKSFSQELHDGLGPMLSTIKIYFQWLAETTDSEKRENIVNTGIQNINDAIQAVREISNKLSPRILDNAGLIQAMKYFINQLNKTRKIKIQISSDSERRYNLHMEVTLYRILSELINNTLKYANAKNISIKITNDLEINRLFIIYKDDGKGFDVDETLKSKKGMGLHSMKQRVETLNGIIVFDSSKHSHLTVRIELPI